MNVGKSLKKALLETGKTQLDMASDLGVHPTLLNRHFNSEHINTQTISIYSNYFNIKVSELIALGE